MSEKSKTGVLISIRPQWCELIARGKKKVEIRKTMPKLDQPFKCYIYCTTVKALNLADYVAVHARTGGRVDDWSTMVIGEFTCDWIEPIHVYRDGAVQNWMYAETDRSGLTYEEVAAYIGKEKTGYAWHISDLKIYDHPKRLDDFQKPCPNAEKCSSCNYHYSGDWQYEPPHCVWDDAAESALSRPPQSWFYVEVPE